MLIKTQKNISVSQLKPAPHNPEGRMQPKRLRTLERSLAKYGQLMPLLVSADNVIIEGHRRWAAAKRIGLETLLCIIVEGKADAIYATVNSTQQRITGNDALGIWLKNPDAVTPNMSTRLARMEDVLGRKLFTEMYRNNFAPNAFNLAVRIARLAMREDDGTIQAIVAWFMRYPMVNKVHQLLKEGESADTILRAVKSGKPIRLRLAMDERQENHAVEAKL